ncbi:MAG: TonB-dependent receptor [Pseudomonadales bacterium]|jgi:iron complex outermembrane receptor protein
MSIQTIKKTLLASALLGSALSHSLVTLAEETSADRVFEEVVVTARKRQEGAQSVPIPISAISAEQLETRNLTEIRDIEKLSPNTDIDFSPSNGTSAMIFMRGIGQVNWSGTQDPKIGIYVDGVYLSRAQGALVDFNDVERVEVLRGPQGTLFGRNTTAGLVHIINKKPNAESFESDITLGVGNDGQRKWGLMLNTPLSDQISARLSVSGQQADGVIINSVTGNDRGNEDSQSARLALRWQNDALDALLSYSKFEADERGALATCNWYAPSDPFAGLARGGLPAVAVIFGTYNQMQANCESTTRDLSIDMTNDERNLVDVDNLLLNVSYDFGPLTVTSITSQRNIEHFNGSWGWVMGNGPGSNFLEILNNHGETDAFSQELRVSGGTERLDWVVGAYWFEEETDEGLDVPLFRGVAAPDPAVWPFFYAPDGAGSTLGAAALGAQIYGSRYQAYDVINENQAFFAELTYSVTDQWDVTLGARYTSDDRDFTRIQTLFGGAFDPFYFCPGMPTVELAPGVPASASDRCRQTVSYSKTTPRVIVSYQPSSDLMFYGSYSMGYSSGGFNQDVRMRAYLPETADNFEFGVKSDLIDGRLRLNATVFSNQYENQQLTVGRLVNGQPTADLINAQQATLNGFELEVLGRLTDQLTVTLSLGYLKGEYDEFTVIDNVTVVAEDGSLSSVETERDLSYIEFGNKGKNLSMDIGLLHNMSLGGGGEIVSSIGATFKDDRYYTLENTPSSFQPSYWLVDGRITWFLSNGQSSVSLWGNNLTDKDYVTTMIDQAGTIQIGGADPSLGMAASYWGEPRRFGLEFRHSF